MAVVMDSELKRKLEKVKKRETWPVALLAELLGRPRRYVYRRIEDDSFDIIEDGGFMKVTSKSVVTFFEERMQKV